MDTETVLPMWANALDVYNRHIETVPFGLVHSDTWPPNIICKKDKVMGLIDFDDCCFGARVIDVAVPAMEFCMFQTSELDEEILNALFAGYFTNGGGLLETEKELLIPVMIMCCCVWLVYNVIQAPMYENAHVYLRKLHTLQKYETKDMIIHAVDKFT